MTYLIDRLLNAPRLLKQFLMIGGDFILLSSAIVLAFSLQAHSVLFSIDASLASIIFGTTFTSIYFFSRLGLYHAVIRFMSHEALFTVFKGVCISSVILAVFMVFIKPELSFASVVIYFSITLCLIGYTRLSIRQLISRKTAKTKINVAIYGANEAGLALLASLRQSTIYNPVILVDERRLIRNIRYNGIKVRSPKSLPALIPQYAIKQVLLAMPTMTSERKKQVIEQLEPLCVRVRTIPAMEDLLSGAQKIEHLEDIKVEDLLGRAPVKPIPELLQRCIQDQTVLVTGAGGSIGAELCRQILRQQPSTLILLERCEEALYQIDMELKKYVTTHQINTDVIPLLGCVQNKLRLGAIFNSYTIDTVYHAAAYKHVPLIEYNINEGVRNNVFGTYQTALAAQESGVKNFVLVSTDKAVRPTNIMGASKRLAELVLQAMAQSKSGTRFSMVRFGNVLGSSGSVVPLFIKQIAEGGPVTVTHPEVIRYFMTIPEASQLVIQAGAMAKGGDVFVLDMGEPVKITDLAHSMIRLHGLTIKDKNHPEGDIEIQYSGLRPGEKLFEELLIGSNVSATNHPKIMRANERCLNLAQVEQILSKLTLALEKCDCKHVREILLKAGTDYTGSDCINDLVWNSAKHAISVANDYDAVDMPVTSFAM